MNGDGGRPDVHDWINSAGVVLALIVAGVSAYFSWQTFESKKDAIGFSVLPTNRCKVQFQKIESGGFLGICWSVTLINQSENKLAIVRARTFGVKNGARFYFSGFQEMEGTSGGEVVLPIVLDGGEARTIIVRAPVEVSETVAKIVESLPRPLSAISMNSLSHTLATHQLDFVGNSLDLLKSEGKIFGWQLRSPVKYALALLEIKTGRGAIFSTPFVWPPGARPD